MSTPERDINQLERDAAEMRARLAETVDQLAAKADVKSHAQRKASEIKEQLPFVGGAEPKEAARSAVQQAQSNRSVLIAGGGVVLVLALAVARRRKRRQRRQRERELERLQENPLAALIAALGRSREIAERVVAR